MFLPLSQKETLGVSTNLQTPVQLSGKCELRVDGLIRRRPSSPAPLLTRWTSLSDCEEAPFH